MDIKYDIEKNAPATDATITQAEDELGLPLPQCVKDFCKVNDGFQVYHYHYNPLKDQRSNINFYRCVFATSENHIKNDLYPELYQNGTFASGTKNYQEVSDMLAEEDDIYNLTTPGYVSDVGALDGYICIGFRAGGLVDQFTYWMRGEPDAMDVYCIEDHQFTYAAPPTIRKQLEKPLMTFADYIATAVL